MGCSSGCGDHGIRLDRCHRTRAPHLPGRWSSDHVDALEVLVPESVVITRGFPVPNLRNA
jgi:hypothetical protein